MDMNPNSLDYGQHVQEILRLRSRVEELEDGIRAHRTTVDLCPIPINEQCIAIQHQADLKLYALIS